MARRLDQDKLALNQASTHSVRSITADEPNTWYVADRKTFEICCVSSGNAFYARLEYANRHIHSYTRLRVRGVSES